MAHVLLHNIFYIDGIHIIMITQVSMVRRILRLPMPIYYLRIATPDLKIDRSNAIRFEFVGLYA